MLKIIQYLASKGVVTARDLFPQLNDGVQGLPAVTEAPCSGTTCGACIESCPTDAITIVEETNAKTNVERTSSSRLELDLGSCITCGLCTDLCPTGTIVNNRTTRTARTHRNDLLISNASEQTGSQPQTPPQTKQQSNTASIFKRSIAVRVVSTGCTACDLEIGAASNPIFDMERFGIHVVASPRFADVLLVTGPVPKAMHDPLKSCYEAMAEPRLVVAVGTCAISGGVHRDGYSRSNGVSDVIPVSVYIPGCPPHPWSIIDGILTAMNAKR